METLKIVSMEKTGKVIAFGNHKGGVGKSTLLVNFCAYMYKRGEKFAVIDCDIEDPTTFRISDLAEESPYEIISLPPKNLIDHIDDYLYEFDYVLLDLPGTIGDDDVFAAYTVVDYLFIPSRPTDTDMSSTIDFVLNKDKYPKIYNLRKENGRETFVGILFNSVKSKDSPELAFYNDKKDSFGYAKIMDFYFLDKIKAQRIKDPQKYLVEFIDALSSIYKIIKDE